MANLVKYNYVICDEDKRVINSNEIIAQKIKELAEAEKYVDSEGYDDEFSENIDADKVEKLLADKQEALETSKEEAEHIIEDANAQAEQILNNAQQEVEELKNQAYAQGEKQGYDDGYRKGLGELEALKQEVATEKLQLEETYQKQLTEMEPQLVDALINVFENVFSIQFSEKKDFIVHLLQSSFSKIDSSKEYLIRVSREDYPYLQEHREDIVSELPQTASVEFVEDLTLNKNQCLIETDGGVFDCSLDTQMESLIRDLRMLSSL